MSPTQPTPSPAAACLDTDFLEICTRYYRTLLPKVTTLDAVTPVGSVAVFASCTDHRPESIAHFESQLSTVGFDCRVVHPGELRPGFGGGGKGGGGGAEGGSGKEEEAPSFRVLEMRRVRRGTS